MLKQEILRRMKLLGIGESVINDYNEKEVIYLSTKKGIKPIPEKEMYDKIKKIEREHDVIVYHAILDYTALGCVLSLLYVSNSNEDWEIETSDIKLGTVFAYVMNLEDDDFSEFGTIKVKPYLSGLKRVI